MSAHRALLPAALLAAVALGCRGARTSSEPSAGEPVEAVPGGFQRGAKEAADRAGAGGEREQAAPSKVPPRLLEAARRGPVRVLVELEGDFEVDQAWTDQDRESLDAVQQRVLRGLSPAAADSATLYQEMPFLAVEAQDQKDLRSLAASTDVRAVLEDTRLRLQAVAAPPALDDTVPLIGAAYAHGLGSRGAGQTIVVIDSGVDDTQPALAGRVIAGGFYTSDEPADCSGAPVTACPLAPGAAAAGRPLPGQLHGTRVALVAAADGAYYDGVAPEADLVSLRVTDSSGEALTSDVLSALWDATRWADVHGVAAVCLALGVDFDSTTFVVPCEALVHPMRWAVARLDRRGVPVVSGIGNAGEEAMWFPACLPGMVTVAGTTKPSASAGEMRSPYSNYASGVDLLAPCQGVQVPTSFGTVGTPPGTSIAVPHVAGAIALIVEHVGVSPLEALQALEEHGVPIELEPAALPGVTAPRIDVEAVILALTAP